MIENVPSQTTLIIYYVYKVIIIYMEYGHGIDNVLTQKNANINVTENVTIYKITCWANVCKL